MMDTRDERKRQAVELREQLAVCTSQAAKHAELGNDDKTKRYQETIKRLERELAQATKGDE